MAGISGPIHTSDLFNVASDDPRIFKRDGTTTMTTSVCALHHSIHHAVKCHVEAEYYKHWCSFSYERVAPDLIMDVVSYLLGTYAPHGAVDSSSMNVLISAYLPKLSPTSCESIWWVMYNETISILGIDQSLKLELKYDIYGDRLTYTLS
jgi:hypothetical protein